MKKKDVTDSTTNSLGFFSQLSHEIRTPLNSIIGLTELLKNPASKEQQEEYLQILEHTTSNLLELSNNILDFSKIKSGNIQETLKEFNLASTLEKGISDQKVIAKSKGVELLIEMDERIPAEVVGDPVKIGQVLTNLVSNAVKFTEKGKITVSFRYKEVTDTDISVTCSVKDTGIGIPEEHLETIFDEFRRGSEETNMRFAGTGLGLSISKRLVEVMGGELRVFSKPGEGSEFTFSLSLHPSERNVFPREGILPNEVNELNILVVEDDPINLLIIEKHLEKWGFKSDRAYNGKEAVDKLQDKTYDLILMDLQMPVMDGFQSVKAIREYNNGEFYALPIIALTAANGQLLQEKIEAAGFNNFLTKPFHSEQLYEKILNETRHSERNLVS